MIRKLTLSLAAAVLSFASFGAQAATVTGILTIDSATLIDVYSGTLDPACIPGGGFFTCGTLPAARAVAVSNTGGPGAGGGSINLDFDDTTGEIIQINSLDIQLGSLFLTITSSLFGSGEVTVTPGNDFPVPSPGDVAGMMAGIIAANGTADANQNLGSPGVFQHNDLPNTDATDFSTFADIIDLCTPTSTGSVICGLAPGLSLDAVRYQIDGTVAVGANSLTIRSETSNNSRTEIAFSGDLQIVPVPAAVWLFGSALGLLGWMRRSSKVA